MGAMEGLKFKTNLADEGSVLWVSESLVPRNFFLAPEKAQYHNASQSCQDHGGKLAMIRTLFEVKIPRYANMFSCL